MALYSAELRQAHSQGMAGIKFHENLEVLYKHLTETGEKTVKTATVPKVERNLTNHFIMFSRMKVR